MTKRVDHDDRREELVLAAWRVIAAKGIDEVTIRDIARESGYSSGVLAHYFKNKDDLLAHALRLSHTRIRKRYDAEREQAEAADALKAILLDNLPLDEQREMETRIEMSCPPLSETAAAEAPGEGDGIRPAAARRGRR
jgi:AcrR family transcriptional regulator